MGEVNTHDKWEEKGYFCPLTDHHSRPNFQLLTNQVENFYFRWGTDPLHCPLVWTADLERALGEFNVKAGEEYDEMF